MEFDPRNVNGYTFEQLKEFINNGVVDFPKLQSLGLNWQMQAQVKQYFENLEIKKSEIATEFRAASSINTIPSYNIFIRKYEDNEFTATYGNLAADYIAQARMAKAILEEETIRYKQDLLNDMDVAPWKYTAEIMSILFNGVGADQMAMIRENNEIDSVIRNFILSGMRLQYQDLLDNNIIPENVSQKDICAPDYRMPQKSVQELGTFPTDRTDVYFLGVPRSGKSSVLSGIMYKLYSKGQAAYEPHFVNGVDPCASYYKGLIKAMASKKPPVGTPTDSISFMKLNIRNGNRRNEVTIVEMSGEAFKGISAGQESQDSKDRWKKLGATQCISVPNRKCLFFVIDYSVVRELDGAYCTNIEQAMMLGDALKVFCYDGPDSKKPHVGCTMSKVDTVAIIMTKCDLMEGVTDRSGRLDEAERYIEENFAAFANDLAAACNKFGINRANNCMPYILTFSLGNFYVGNTVVFNDQDSDEIIKFISDVTKSVKNDRTNFLGF